MPIRRIIIALIIAALLIPSVSGLDDGGSVEYAAVLYTVRKQHSMAEEDGKEGYNVGTRVRILFFEVYDDVRFVPSE